MNGNNVVEQIGKVELVVKKDSNVYLCTIGILNVKIQVVQEVVVVILLILDVHTNGNNAEVNIGTVLLVVKQEIVNSSMNGILNVEMILMIVDVNITLNVVKNGTNAAVKTGQVLLVAKQDQNVLFMMNGIHNVWIKKKIIQLTVVEKNGINAEVKTGRVEHVAKQDNVFSKMNGIHNVWIIQIQNHQNLIIVAVVVVTTTINVVEKIGKDLPVVNKENALNSQTTFLNV